MIDYSIKETFTLPSKGLIYKEKFGPKVTLKSMTTMDEMLRLSPTDLPYKNLADLIDSCIIDETSMSAYDLCIGDF